MRIQTSTCIIVHGPANNIRTKAVVTVILEHLFFTEIRQETLYIWMAVGWGCPEFSAGTVHGIPYACNQIYNRTRTTSSYLSMYVSCIHQSCTIQHCFDILVHHMCACTKPLHTVYWGLPMYGRTKWVKMSGQPCCKTKHRSRASWRGHVDVHVSAWHLRGCDFSYKKNERWWR